MCAINSVSSGTNPVHYGYNNNNHNFWLMQHQFLAHQHQQQQQHHQQQFFQQQHQHIIPTPYNNSNSSSNNNTADPPNKLKHKEVVLYKTESCRNWTELGHCRYIKKFYVYINFYNTKFGIYY